MASASRLDTALADGALVLPATGRIAVFAPPAGADLAPLDGARVHVIQGFRPDHDAWAAAGYETGPAPQGAYAAALVFLPRAKDAARDLIARAAALAPDCVVVDGAKTDGVESVLKAVRARVAVGGVVSKAHGKLFWMAPGGAFDDWRGKLRDVGGGFVTAPGVFSADGPDPGSVMLAGALPAELGRHVADLGAGWGYLAGEVLTRPGIERLDVVEADHAALDCARRNIADPRARFHWADATDWHPDAAPDTIVMNPPFHVARAADPGLGRAFIAAAAGLIGAGGQVFVVANRHLPYEAAMTAGFDHVEEIAGDRRFKVLLARRPTRKRRR